MAVDENLHLASLACLFGSPHAYMHAYWARMHVGSRSSRARPARSSRRRHAYPNVQDLSSSSIKKLSITWISSCMSPPSGRAAPTQLVYSYTKINTWHRPAYIYELYGRFGSGRIQVHVRIMTAPASFLYLHVNTYACMHGTVTC